VKNRSILVSSGQLWKLLLGVSGTLAGAFQFLIGLVSVESAGGAARLIPPLAVVAASHVWLVLSIRCPLCGARWYWYGMSQVGFSGWLLGAPWRMHTCPACQWGGDEDRDRQDHQHNDVLRPKPWLKYASITVLTLITCGVAAGIGGDLVSGHRYNLVELLELGGLLTVALVPWLALLWYVRSRG
jgi:hypothetical protein